MTEAVEKSGDVKKETDSPSSPTGALEKEKRAHVERKLTKQPVFLHENCKMYIIDSQKAFDHVVKMFRQDVQDYGIISVDDQTTVRQNKDEPRKNIDLLQIGTLNGRAFLFRLNFINSSEINYVRNILADPSVLKIGSLFKNDVRRLYNEWNISVYNWIDIQSVARNCLDRRTLAGSQGLRSLTKLLVDVDMESFDADTLGDWTVEELSDAQINYAARQVMAILDVFCNVYANKAKLAKVDPEDIKRHVQWNKFCSTAFYNASIM